MTSEGVGKTAQSQNPTGNLKFKPSTTLYTKIYLSIPLDRIGVLVGKEGEVIKKLMERTKTKIVVDSANATVIIEPATQATTAADLMKARDFVQAISYGFSPERAWRLIESDDQVLLVIDLKQYVKPSPNHLQRVKGRIIGEDGRVRKNLEEITGCYISVYDDYVAIIGDYESANALKEAIMMLIEGRQHSTVYKFLDRVIHSIKRRRGLEIWSKERP